MNSYLHPSTSQGYTPATDTPANSVIRLADGRIGVIAGLRAAEAGERYDVVTDAICPLNKPATFVVLPGTRVWYDLVNNQVALKWAAGYVYAGVATVHAALADTTVQVSLNARPMGAIDLADPESPFVSAATNGLGTVKHDGYHALAFDATGEAAKADLLSERSVASGQGFIFHCLAAIYDKGDDASLDMNLGVASSTHATDCDSIAEAVFFHLDGNSLAVKAESDDGTTEVSATDTTVAAVDDTYHLFQIDARDLTDIKLYIDGVNVLAAETFTLAAGSAAMKALVHMEKTSNDTTAEVRVAELRLIPTDVSAA